MIQTKFQSCIEACLKCVAICNQCAIACLNEDDVAPRSRANHFAWFYNLKY